MPLRFVTDSTTLADEALRLHRGKHDIMYARLNNSEWAQWTARMCGARVDSTIASRLTYMDFSPETKERFNKVAKAMLSMGHGRQTSTSK